EVVALDAASKRILADAQSGSGRIPSELADCVQRYSSFNRSGHAIARSVLARCRARVLLKGRIAPCSSVWDEHGTRYCAGTTRNDFRIRWAHQPTGHGLFAALIPEMIFAHEYLSHLSANNRRLSLTITEIWLVEALLCFLQYESEDEHH